MAQFLISDHAFEEFFGQLSLHPLQRRFLKDHSLSPKKYWDTFMKSTLYLYKLFRWILNCLIIFAYLFINLKTILLKGIKSNFHTELKISLTIFLQKFHMLKTKKLLCWAKIKMEKIQLKNDNLGIEPVKQWHQEVHAIFIAKYGQLPNYKCLHLDTIVIIFNDHSSMARALIPA